MLGQNSSLGGLAGLVQAFQKHRLDDIVNSWVRTGKNMPVTPDQIKQGLVGDLLSKLARNAGVSADAAGSQLSSLLPDVIDTLMLNGMIEAGGIDLEDAPVLRAHLLGHAQQACPAKEHRRQSGRASRV